MLHGGTYQSEANTHNLEWTSIHNMMYYPKQVTFTTRTKPSFLSHLQLTLLCMPPALKLLVYQERVGVSKNSTKTQMLAPNGASASILEHAIFALQARG